MSTRDFVSLGLAFAQKLHNVAVIRQISECPESFHECRSQSFGILFVHCFVRRMLLLKCYCNLSKGTRDVDLDSYRSMTGRYTSRDIETQEKPDDMISILMAMVTPRYLFIVMCLSRCKHEVYL